MKPMIALSTISACAVFLAIYLQGQEPIDNPTPSLDEISKSLETLEKVVEKISIRVGGIESSLTKHPKETGPEKNENPEKADLASETGSITVTVTNKRFQDSDPSNGTYEDNIWWDASYTSKLKKTARSLKGVLQFCDLFGEPKFQLLVTIDDPVAPQASITTRGVGFTYNQFMGTHNWMRATKLKDMTFKFKLTHALYSDGTVEKF